MISSRTSQPYRKGPRVPSAALTAMLRGRSTSGWNPKDIERGAQRLVRAGSSRRKRPVRPARPPRPSR